MTTAPAPTTASGPPASLPDPTQLRAAWASIPTPITTVAAVVDGRPVGLIVGSYVGLSLNPALVAVSIQKSSRSWPLLRNADHLGISVLTRDHAALIGQLAGPVDRRFDGLTWHNDRGGVLLEDAAVHLTGHIVNDIDTGDHITAILQVDRVTAHSSATPLVFHGSQVTTVGEL
ncbi:flavin reductase family protein [Corynebacterium terpenotabidum]|uniref:Flavin reductase domain-containing protein FMN-binding protein n=1 Tax=Corynebacterium terpenotabidum Y-11 TaxID=1200352 RepID=S4XGC7_9CORY|nr:flavin reductase family protein [Corynebacterium terpenotabidum]AGP31591.1 flavin reductase domain-containing protein FMN-binding protein [Corynebacterium terpenotabidum Y-11]